MRKPRSKAVPVGDLVGGALRDLGVPSRRITKQVMEAWALAADPAWRDDTEPASLIGGVLTISVGSSALRQELAQFHGERLLAVLRAALPSVPLVGLRFRLAEVRGKSWDGDGERE